MNENKIIELITNLDKKINTRLDNMEKEIKILDKKVEEKIENSRKQIISEVDSKIKNEITNAKKEIVSEVENKMKNAITSAEKKIVSEVVNEFVNFSNTTSGLINKVDVKVNKETKERIYEIDKLKNITEYEKIVLRNLESRISILEEESEEYRKTKNN